MDPTPLPPHPHPMPPPIATVSATSAASTAQHSYPDSAGSSPRSRPDTSDEPLPQVPGAKMRLMCSYGGHIIPRPHDKSLCYVGGDTRIVMVDRNCTLAEFQSRLSHTLLNGRKFALKYQLPNEDLDSLVSITTDEDLENMIEEYDRTNSASPLKPSRLRLFLFPTMPETANSMGALLDDAKSETWFVDALNGAGLLPRGISDSAAVDNLSELQHTDSCCTNLEAQNAANNKEINTTIKNVNNVQDVQTTLSDSPMVETSSSFGSSSSSPSMSNLPPVRTSFEDTNIRMLDQMVGLEENFSILNVTQRQDEGYNIPNPTLPPPMPSVICTTMTTTGANAAASAGENHTIRVISDDERSDQGAQTGIRKPPLPLQPVQKKLVDVHNLPSPDSKHAGGYNLPSPDSVASDGSIASAASLSKYQEAAPSTNQAHRVPPPVIDHKTSNQDPVSLIPVQHHQVPDSGSIQTNLHQNLPHHQQQQYIHASTQYIQHPASYYPMYIPQPQTDPQYQMYLLPITTQAQQYNIPAESLTSDATLVASSRPITPPGHQNPNLAVPASGAYKDPTIPPLYPTKATTFPKAEMATNAYRTGTNMLVHQVPPPHQFQPQYIGVPQMTPPTQPNAGAPLGTGNYAYEYAGPTVHDPVYYAQQQQVTSVPTQYQSMTPAAAMMLSQATAQINAGNNAQIQQMSTSQAL